MMKSLSIRGIKDIVNLWNIAFLRTGQHESVSWSSSGCKLWGTRQICPDQGWTAAQGQVWWPANQTTTVCFKPLRGICFAWLMLSYLTKVLFIIPRYAAVRIEIECWWPFWNSLMVLVYIQCIQKVFRPPSLSFQFCYVAAWYYNCLN